APEAAEGAEAGSAGGDGCSWPGCMAACVLVGESVAESIAVWAAALDSGALALLQALNSAIIKTGNQAAAARREECMGQGGSTTRLVCPIPSACGPPLLAELFDAAYQQLAFALGARFVEAGRGVAQRIKLHQGFAQLRLQRIEPRVARAAAQRARPTHGGGRRRAVRGRGKAAGLQRLMDALHGALPGRGLCAGAHPPQPGHAQHTD